MKRIFLIVSFLMILSNGVKAQSTPGVDQRQQNQKARIKDGVRSGELTRVETRKLTQDQRELRRRERRAKADGEVTAEERSQLHRKENRNSRAIRRQKNDDDKKPRAN